MDSTGAGLAGLQLSLGSYTTTTSADGSYSFSKLPKAFTGELTPTSPTLSFIPGTRNVIVRNLDINDLDFTGFPLAQLQNDLPASAPAGQPLLITLRALDAAGEEVAGYTTGMGDIASDPTGVVVLTPLQFKDGVATAQVRFDTPGEYSVHVSGYCKKVDGLLGMINVVADAPQPHSLHVEKWQGGAQAAVSLSFDDGSADHWSRGLPLWHAYGFHVTLGILANRFLDHPERIPQLQQAFDAGHELANHTTDHLDITTMPLEAAREDIDKCQQLLLNNVQGLNHVLTFIYPYEQFNSLTIAMLQEQGFLFARSGSQDMVEITSLNDGFNPPWYRLYSWANPNDLPISMWNDTVDSAVQESAWLIEQCHGIGAAGEPGVGWSPRPESDYREHYDHIKSYGESVWVAPVSEVGRYVIERNNASFNVLANTAELLEFELHTGLDNSLYNIPLTVWLSRPADWAALRVKQDGAELPFSETEAGRLRIDVIPGSGAVSVERTD